jgi:hypothetical protein
MLTKPIIAEMTASPDLFYNKRNQSHLTGSLDLVGQATLVLGAVPGYPSRFNLADIRNILPDNINALIINNQFCISTKFTVSLLGEFLSFII